MLYRILTEDSTAYRANAIAAIGKHFKSFTALQGQGYWQGQAENSLILEVVGGEADYNKVMSVASEIKSVNFQQAVLVQKIANTDVFI